MIYSHGDVLMAHAGETIKLYDIMYMPRGAKCLLSSGSLCNSGLVKTSTADETCFRFKGDSSMYIRGLPARKGETLHWMSRKIMKPDVSFHSASLA